MKDIEEKIIDIGHEIFKGYGLMTSLHKSCRYLTLNQMK